MMNNEDAPRGAPYQQGRRPYPSKFQENRFGSQENRYGQGENRYGQSPSYGYNKGGSAPYAAGQQHPHKKVDRFRREPVNYSEKLVRQNDLIIKLLKEIRDRLPAPEVIPGAETGGEATIQNASADVAESGDLPRDEAASAAGDDAEDQDAEEESPGNSL
jgi:hypothetical protein